ncbi:MAG TPA: RNA repair transcriptional activator RtcR [Vicinamibacterales bacterium]|nr:RNA repair transcriptional activator RtcR [Vicinamibacterales bacterium]
MTVLGLVGSTLDRGAGPARWNAWRPTVDICRHEDLLVRRFELLYVPPHQALAEQVMADIRSVSPETEVRIHRIDFTDAWDFEHVYGALLDFARQYPFDTDKEDYLVHVTTGTHVSQICLFLLTESRYLPARLLQTAPPRPLVGTRPGTYTIIDLDLSKYDRLATRFAQQTREDLAFLKAGIETRNRTFNALIERIEQVATVSRAPLLLMGPTGAGKSKLARRIFELKKARQRVAGAFVEVNCGTVRGEAAMSALFGHVRGSFTGAVRDRPGLLKAADGGVLFLDEIGELGGDEQGMLLRAIEDKQFLPLGADRETRSDFQLIAGTNADLGAAVRRGRFREDLLARINLWTFTLPGLRDRAEDIEPNLDHELAACALVTGTRVSMNREARARFLAFATSDEAVWSGNFRDFNGAVLRMAALAPAGRITEAIVDEEIVRLRAAWRSTGEDGDGDALAGLLTAAALAEIDPFDRVQLAEVVRVCRRSRSLSDAGRRLFAVSRTRKAAANDADRLRKYLARFGLDWQACSAAR